MGFDVSWHPISRKEMFLWYFDRLEEVRAGNRSKLTALAQEHQLGKAEGNEAFCIARYQEIMDTAAQVGPGEAFDKTHSFILAAVQGLFRTFYYTRGGLYSDLVIEQPEMTAYTTPFQAILGDRLQNPAENRIYENYCGGVYIGEEQVPRLLADYESGRTKEALEGCFGSTLPVFLKALGHAKAEGLGLLEATDLVVPNPFQLQDTSCSTYLMHCDFDGIALYASAARAQMEEAMRAQGEDPAKAQVTWEMHQSDLPPKQAQQSAPPKRPKKKGMFGRLFGGKD